MFRSPWILNNPFKMATTTSTTLSPLVAGAADLARKLAAYKATSNRASGEQDVEHPGEESLSPLDVSFGSSPNVENKFFPKIVPFAIQRERYLSRDGTNFLQIIRESWPRTVGRGISWRRWGRTWLAAWRGPTP